MVLWLQWVVCFIVVCVPCYGTDSSDEVIIENVLTMEACDRKSANGDVVHMHYTGKLSSGKQFDSSIGKEPLNFVLGKGQVIKGWDEGLTGMCIGEKRRLTIPPSKGYGKEGAGDDIPPDSTLIFDVELVNITDSDGSTETETGPDGFFDQLDNNKDNIVTKEELANYITGQSGGQEDDISKSAGGQDEMIEQIFAQEDKNKDGIITRDEFLNDKHDEL